MSPRVCSSKFSALTGTGFAHPKRKLPGMSHSAAGTIRLPTRSRCGNGFSVTRPRAAGVGSPCHTATRAWAYSCATTEKRKIGSSRIS